MHLLFLYNIELKLSYKFWKGEKSKSKKLSVLLFSLSFLMMLLNNHEYIQWSWVVLHFNQFI